MEKTPGQQYMEDSQYAHMGPSEQEQGLPQPPLVLDYSGPGPILDLPKPDSLSFGQVPLIDMINQRKTLRKYSGKPLTCEELSYLLWTTQGVKSRTARPVTLRTVPSAGARHAFETYVLVNQVEGLQPGLYHFLALEHQLGVLTLDSAVSEQITEACLKQEQVRSSAATFIWVAVAARMRWRYGERGYRYMHLDAGHVCQNLYLAAESVGCGVCAIAAFDDNALNQALGLDGIEQFVIYLGSLGKRILR